jgi:hypothetical protein
MVSVWGSAASALPTASGDAAIPRKPATARKVPVLMSIPHRESPPGPLPKIAVIHKGYFASDSISEEHTRSKVIEVSNISVISQYISVYFTNYYYLIKTK